MVANKTKSKDDVISLMIDKINELAEMGERVSKHVVPTELYKKHNIIDIGVRSTQKVSKNFNIERFIDETKVGKKSLLEDIDASILSIIR